VERVKNLDAYSPEAITMQMKRINFCSVHLELYDNDEFLLRTALIPFAYGEDDQARIAALTANTAMQMDASEYRKIKAWSINWYCPTEP
jgi:hypothetical protein